MRTLSASSPEATLLANQLRAGFRLSLAIWTVSVLAVAVTLATGVIPGLRSYEVLAVIFFAGISIMVGFIAWSSCRTGIVVLRSGVVARRQRPAQFWTLIALMVLGGLLEVGVIGFLIAVGSSRHVV
jgi:hypothetical protein